MNKHLKNTGQFFWNNRNRIILIVAIILAVLYFKQCGTINYERKKAEQNQKALTENVERVQLKNKEIMSQKAALIADKKELKKMNADLSEEYEILKKEKSKPKVIIQTKLVYTDTGSVKNTAAQLDSNKYSLMFSYMDSDGILSIKGRSEFMAYPKLLDGSKSFLGLDIKPGKTYFDTTRIKLGLVLGIKEDKDGVDRIFAKPKPYSDKIVFDELDAVQVEEYYKSKYNNPDKKKGRVSIGLYGGYGLNVGQGGVIRLGPQFGVGINYRLFKIPFF